MIIDDLEANTTHPLVFDFASTLLTKKRHRQQYFNLNDSTGLVTRDTTKATFTVSALPPHSALFEGKE